MPRAWSDSSRPHWSSRVQFTLSAVCLACGFNCLVNVPLSAARNGGGTFIVVYACLLFLVGYPITLLLCLLGQYYQVGSSNPLGTLYFNKTHQNRQEEGQEEGYRSKKLPIYHRYHYRLPDSIPVSYTRLSRIHSSFSRPLEVIQEKC